MNIKPEQLKAYPLTLKNEELKCEDSLNKTKYHCDVAIDPANWEKYLDEYTEKRKALAAIAMEEGSK